MLTYIIVGLSGLCCCLGFVLIILLIVGIVFMRKKGQKVTEIGRAHV